MKDNLFLALLETSTLHALRCREVFQQMNLSEGQPKVLYILLDHPGCIQKQLAEWCGIRQSTLAVMLERMLEKGLIYKERISTPGGKFANQIYLTAKGLRTAQQVEQFIAGLEECSMQNFTPEERTLLLSLLGSAAENLRK